MLKIDPKGHIFEIYGDDEEVPLEIQFVQPFPYHCILCNKDYVPQDFRLLHETQSKMYRCFTPKEMVIVEAIGN